MTTDTPTYPQPTGPTGTPPPAPDRRRERWLLVGVAAWAVALLVLAWFSVRRDAPTVREQRSIGEALPLVDRAVGELVAASGPDVTVEIAERRLEEGCRLSVVRDGAILSSGVTFRTTGAGAPALLDRLAARLPADRHARARHSEGGTVHTFRAEPGDFILVEGGVTEPGVVTLTVTTGCRPPSPEVDLKAELLPDPDLPDRTGPVLAALGVTDGEVTGKAAGLCPDGATAVTTRVVGRRTGDQPYERALRPVIGAGATVVTAPADGYAYRSGPVSVVVEPTGDGRIRVTDTNGCG